MQKNGGDLDRAVLAMMAVSGLADVVDNGIEKTPRPAVLVSFLASGVLFTAARPLRNYPRGQITALTNCNIEV